MKFSSIKAASSVVEEVHNVLSQKHVKKVFRLGSDIVNEINPFIDNPTWMTGARALLGVGKILVNEADYYSDDFFNNGEWLQPYSTDFNPLIIKLLSKFPQTVIKTSEENVVIKLVTVDNVKIAWTSNTKLKSISPDLYVKSEHIDQGREIIKHLLWEHFKGKPLVMHKGSQMVSSYEESKIAFEIDDTFNPLPSEQATRYASYLTRCFNAGVHRSVMLYGSPGTGKSTMARTLVDILKLRSFRIRVEDIRSLDNKTLFEAINIFEPDAVILDDFDRTHQQAMLLETLEFFQRHVKLVVATVNEMNSLDDALLRPGRFDELMLVERMDEGVVKKTLGQYVDGFDLVKNWPIAFIQEYCKRRRFMDLDEAANAMIELSSRVKNLSKYDAAQLWSQLEPSNAHDDSVDQNVPDTDQPGDDVPSTMPSVRSSSVSGSPSYSLAEMFDYAFANKRTGRKKRTKGFTKR